MPSLGGIRDGLAFALTSAIPELGTANGFDLYLVDQGSSGHEELMKVRNQYIYAASQTTSAAQVRANGMDDTPQLRCQH